MSRAGVDRCGSSRWNATPGRRWSSTTTPDESRHQRQRQRQPTSLFARAGAGLSSCWYSVHMWCSELKAEGTHHAARGAVVRAAASAGTNSEQGLTTPEKARPLRHPLTAKLSYFICSMLAAGMCVTSTFIGVYGWAAGTPKSGNQSRASQSDGRAAGGADVLTRTVWAVRHLLGALDERPEEA